MTCAEEPAGESERSTALAGWVVAFDREMVQGGDFATSVAAMSAHGCFDVRAVAERWILANPTGTMPLVQVEPALQEPVPGPLCWKKPRHSKTPKRPASRLWTTSRRCRGPRPDRLRTSPYFHSLLQGGIERAQLYEAFPGFRLAIDEAVGQHEAAAPILSDVPPSPTREDLNDEIRGIRRTSRRHGNVNGGAGRRD